MFRFLPPAGSPLSPKRILRAARGAFHHSEPSIGLARVAERLGVRHAFGISSGRAALTAILQSLHRLSPDRDVVAVPAYTCFSVPASVARAELRIYPIEINPQTLDLEISQLESLPKDRLLCIVTASLFGFVSDTERIRKVAQTKGAFVVDDAAQALGASRDGRLAGTLGDVGLFSFARGKAVAGVGGGLIVTDSEPIAATVRQELGALAPSSFAESAKLVAAMSAYSVLLRPRLYWLPNSLPFLKLGLTEYEPDFPIGRLAPVAEALMAETMDDLDDVNRARRKRAAQLQSALEGSPELTVPMPAANCSPTYIRFPLIARDEETRRLKLAQLRDAGIGASGLYPAAVCDIPDVEKHMATADFHRPQAEALSRQLLTLPTHPYVRDSDVEKMIAILLAKRPGLTVSTSPESTRSNRAVHLGSVK